MTTYLLLVVGFFLFFVLVALAIKLLMYIEDTFGPIVHLCIMLLMASCFLAALVMAAAK